MSVDVGSAKGYLDLDISGFLAGLRTAQTEADNASKSIASKVGTNISNMGKSLTSAGKTLTKTVTVPIVGAGAAVVKLSSDFESAMSKVSAISGATGSDLDILNAKAQEMGAKTKFSATEAAEAFTYMAMAGWKTEAMIEGIDGIMNLAAADGLDLATTSDIVTDALTAFGLEAKDSAHFADVLAKASSAANTNVSLLGESFKYVAPVAGALGYSAEDTAVALGLMANAGIKGSQGGTALRSSLSRLIKPTDDAAGLMEEYDLYLTNADGSMKSLMEVMKMLRTNLGGLTEAEQAQVAATLFGQEAMSGMLSVINASDKDFNNLTNQIYNADGAAEQMANTMLNNLSGQVTILKSSLEGLALQFGEIILPYVKQFVEWIQNLIQKFQGLSPEQKEQIVKWGAIALAIGPALVVLGKFTSGVGGLITTLSKVPTAITGLITKLKSLEEGFLLAKAGFPALGAEASKFGSILGSLAASAGPIMAIVAAVALVVAAFVNLWKNNEEFRNNIIGIWNQITETFNSFAQGIVDRLNALGFDFENIIEVLQALWDGFCNFLAPIFEGVFQYIADTLGAILGVITGILDIFIGLFTGNWQQMWDGVKGIFESIWNGIVDWFQNIGNVLLGVLNSVCGWFGTTWEEVWTNINNFFVSIWNGIVNFFTGLWGGIVGTVQSAWNSIVAILSTVGGWIYDNVIAPIANFFVGLWNGIVNAWHAVIDPWIEIFRRLSVIFYEDVILPIGNFFTNLWDGIVSGLQSAWDWIVNIASTIAGWFNTYVIQPVANFFTGLWNGISGAAKAAWDGIVSVWNIVTSWFANKVIFPITNLFKGIWDGIKNGAKGAWDGIVSVFSGVVNWFKNIFSNAWNAVKNVFSAGGKVFDGIKEGIVSVFKTVVNALIKGINAVVALPFKGLNGILDTIHGIDILGVKPFGWLTWRAPVPQLPYLAEGAVLPPNNPFLAVVGDQKRGTNVEAPLATIQEAVALVIKDFVQDVIALQKIAISILSESRDELGYISHNGFIRVDGESKEFENNNRDDSGGDTFNFYSPKPIDEIEAAKQMKKAKRDLAEGF